MLESDLCRNTLLGRAAPLHTPVLHAALMRQTRVCKRSLKRKKQQQQRLPSYASASPLLNSTVYSQKQEILAQNIPRLTQKDVCLVSSINMRVWTQVPRTLQWSRLWWRAVYKQAESDEEFITTRCCEHGLYQRGDWRNDHSRALESQTRATRGTERFVSSLLTHFSNKTLEITDCRGGKWCCVCRFNDSNVRNTELYSCFCCWRNILVENRFRDLHPKCKYSHY